MSDISIPGVNSKYGTQTIIDSLVKVEKNKLVKMQADQKDLENTKVVWQEANKYMSNVRDAARGLYGFNNPFGAKLGSSSDEKTLTVAATRAASNGEYSVKVISPASNDRFLSKSLPLDKQVPSGDYLFKVGDKEIALTFRGGKLQAFVDAINLKKPELLKASVIKDSADTQILQIEAVPVGKKNALTFQKAAASTLQDLGMIGPPEGFKKVLQDGEVSVAPRTTKSFSVDAPLAVPAGAELKLTVKVAPAPDASASATPTGFVLPDGGSVTYEGISVDGASMQGNVPPPPPPPAPPEVKSMKGLSLNTDQGVVALPDLPDTETATSYSYTVANATTLKSLDFSNGNSGRSVILSSIQIIDPKTGDGLVPRHAVARSADATVEFEGIRIQRDTNAVSDVIPGVTLNLLASSDTAVKVKVEPDKKAIKDGIINFMGNYNRLITDILVLTSIRDSNPSASPIITEAAYLSDDEKKRAQDNLGRFQGDISLNQLKSAMQRVMMNPYPADGSSFTLLSQVGISTNASSSGDKVNASKLRGYLELDEPKLDAAIAQDVDGVRKLFGNSTDGTLVVNTGAAFGIDELLKPNTQLGGFNAMHISTIDSDIAAKKKEISNYNDYLARYQQDLKNKYGQMEASLNQLNKNASSLNGLNTTGQ